MTVHPLHQTSSWLRLTVGMRLRRGPYRPKGMVWNGSKVPFMARDGKFDRNEDGQRAPGVRDKTRSVAKATRPRAQRLSPKERERLIISGAVPYFARVGFGGDMRSLAAHLGIGHPLLFKYFPNKESLIERVYQEVFVGRWNPLWETVISNRSLSLRDRLCDVYKSYCRTILHYEWIRLFMFAGLKSSGVNTRWLQFITEHLAKPVCAEVRETLGLPDFQKVAVTELELELVLGISSRIVGFALRKHIYGTPVPRDLEPIIEAEIDVFVVGCKAVVPEIVRKASARKVRRQVTDK
jgi:AcrR family transcriptional regulator